MTDDEPPQPLTRRGKGKAMSEVEEAPDALPLQQQAAMEAGKDGSDKLLDRLRKHHTHGYGNYAKLDKGDVWVGRKGI
jgi:hypothetical protein